MSNARSSLSHFGTYPPRKSPQPSITFFWILEKVPHKKHHYWLASTWKTHWVHGNPRLISWRTVLSLMADGCNTATWVTVQRGRQSWKGCWWLLGGHHPGWLSSGTEIITSDHLAQGQESLWCHESTTPHPIVSWSHFCYYCNGNATKKEAYCQYSSSSTHSVVLFWMIHTCFSIFNIQ